jgi:4-amino-4-deoxy-L-arabinose transferase-like glycosyltransferase
VNRHRDDFLPIAGLLLLSSMAFVHLMALPAFEDEGSQLGWIWRIVEAGEWLQPLSEGKPLEAWAMVPLVRLGLPVIRAVHVLAGMIAVVLTYRLALELGDRWAAFTSGALVALCPFVVYLQRLACSDILLCAAGLWVLLSTATFMRSPTSWHAGEFSAALLLAAFCKLPIGFVFVIAMPLALLLMPPAERRTLLQGPAAIKWLGAYVPTVLLALIVAVSTIIRLRRGQVPGFGLHDLVGIGMGHYQDIAGAIGVARPQLIHEIAAQLSWPVTVIGLIGLAAGLCLGNWRRRWLIAVAAVPLLAIGLFAGFWFPRYLLFTLPPLIVAAVSGWQALARFAGWARQPVQWGAFAVCAGFMGHQCALIILDPVEARWSPVDRFQYIEGWGSGYGYPDAAKFLLEAPHPPKMIYSLDRHSDYQLLTYLPAEWIGRVKSIYFGRSGEFLRSTEARLGNLLSVAPAWIIVPKQLLQGDLEMSFGLSNPNEINLHQIAEFDKPGSRTQLALYEVAPR